VSFDILEWILFEQVHECEQLYTFLASEKWTMLSMGKDILKFIVRDPMRVGVVHKD